MGKVQLRLRARLENVATVALPAAYVYAFRIRCTSCRETHDKWIEVNREERHEMPGSRGEAHLVMKCKFCRRDMSLDILEDKVAGTLTSETPGFQPVATLDVRGLELVDFKPGDGFEVACEGSNKRFEDVDLSDREWADYDDDANLSVGVYDLESEFVTL